MFQAGTNEEDLHVKATGDRECISFYELLLKFLRRQNVRRKTVMPNGNAILDAPTLI